MWGPAAVLAALSSDRLFVTDYNAMRSPNGPGLRSRDPLTSNGGGRGPIPVDYDWGGGDHRGGGDDDQLPSYPERLRRARFAVYVILASIVMLFVGFSTLMLARRAGGGRYDAATSNFVSDWTPMALPIKLLLLNTLILGLSSLTLEFARKQARRRVALFGLHVPGVTLGREVNFPWLGSTLILATAFLYGQYRAWGMLHHHGVYLGSMISSSFFFILTGAHAAHLVAGMSALTYAGIVAAIRRAPENYRLVIDATSVFWHFMGILWVYLFALLYFSAT
jgi:cytochrome c oxidase subunit 3